MSGTAESVIRMANQIARNFAAHGEEQAVTETANHIKLFWDPRMKAKAFELLAEPENGFSAQARAAMTQLAGEPESSARARMKKPL